MLLRLEEGPEQDQGFLSTGHEFPQLPQPPELQEQGRDRGSEEQQYGEEYFDAEEYDYEKNRVDTLPTLLKNISRHELEDFVKPIVDNSQSASMKIKDGIDLLFIL